MKGGLFWKTLLGFWLAYFIISQGVALPFVLFHYQPYDDQLASRMGPAVLELCSQSIGRSGLAGCEAALGKLKPDDRERLSVVELAAGAAPSGCGRAAQGVDAAAPDGRRYQICYHYNPAPPWPRYILSTPPEVLAIGALGGLAFSAALAWYLIVPIQRIRQGFKSLAEGRLETRVGDATGGRRDEIADMARDFDWMASRLEELVAARDRLLHDVSHEFRSPLSRLQLAIALARQDGRRLPRSLDRIEHEASRLNDMVNELLTLARVEGGLPSDEYFDLAGVVESVASDAEFEAKAGGVKLAARLPVHQEEAPHIRGSSELIRRAIDNVVRNAIKVSSSGQIISLELCFDPAQGQFRIGITDEGPGVPAHALAHVFEPFVKADPHSAGLGLGLSIAKRAVEAHGGRIEAANRPEGGLKVTIFLPATPETASAGPLVRRAAWSPDKRIKGVRVKEA